MRVKRIFLILVSVLFFIVLAISPSVSTGLTDIYNEKRLLQSAILFLGSLFFIYLFFQNKLNLKQQNSYLWLSFFVLLGVSILLSEYVEWAALEIGWYIGLLQLAFISAFIFQKFPKTFERYLLLIVISFAALYSIRVAGDIITGLVDPDWPNWPDHTRSVIIFNGENFAKNGFLGFKNIRFFNHLQTWSLPILIYGYIKYQTKLNYGFQTLFFVLISFFWMLAFASGARGTVLSLLISSVIVFLLFKEHSKEWLKKGIITCFAGFLMYLIVFYVLIPEGAGKTLARTDSNQRLKLWGGALEAILSNPIWGLGPMHIADINSEKPINSPHNMYLLWIAEWGIPTFLIGGFIALKSMYRWLQSVFLKTSTKKVVLSFSFIAGIVHSGVSGLLITPLSQLLFALLLGWALGIYYNEIKQSLWISRDSRWNGFLKSIPIIILTLFICVKVGMMVPQLEENKQKFHDMNRQGKIELFPTSRATIYPRFWEQGFIGLEEIKTTKQGNNE